MSESPPQSEGMLPGPESAQDSKNPHALLSPAERTRRALVMLAYFIELDGDVHLPLFEKFEAELAEFQRAEATRERARRLRLQYRGWREGDRLQKFEL